jgi:N-acetylated-alpha-linked acidic dipeptidase
MAESSETYLSQRVIAYLNVDIAVSSPSGLLDLSGTVSLSNVTRAVTASISVPHNLADVPANATTLYDLWQLSSNNSNILDASSMGTGSDYGSFMQHLGIACLDLRYSGGANDGYEGVYHTLYDDYRYMSLFGDPIANNFAWMTSLTGLWGEARSRTQHARTPSRSFLVPALTHVCVFLVFRLHGDSIS